MTENIQNLKKKIDGAEENVLLRDFTTMGVGGVADLFYVAKNIYDLTNAINEAINCKIPYLVLGGGSNMIISDSGFPGIVIKNETSNIVRIPNTSQLIVDSGITNERLLSEMAEQQLTGIEFIAGIPGTIGGAVYGNAGCYGMQISDFVKEVTILHPAKNKIEDIKIVKHSASFMEYEYHSSKLKRTSKSQSLKILKPIILTIKLGLGSAKKDDILIRIREYKDLRKKLPQGKSSGCIFRNPERTPEKAAGRLIEQAKLKKKRIGDAYVSGIHANYIMNKDRASASQVRELIDFVRTNIKENYGIDLEEEVEYIGRW